METVIWNVDTKLLELESFKPHCCSSLVGGDDKLAQKWLFQYIAP